VRTEGQTDGDTRVTKLIAAFRNFTKAPVNSCLKREIMEHTCRLLWLINLCNRNPFLLLVHSKTEQVIKKIMFLPFHTLRYFIQFFKG